MPAHQVNNEIIHYEHPEILQRGINKDWRFGFWNIFISG